jgi:hypothetical protein
MDKVKVASELFRLAKELMASEKVAVDLSDKDKKVLDAFIDGKAAESKKFETDGKTLDGLWMGGKSLAKNKDGKIVPRDATTKSEETILKALKKMTPANRWSE